VAENLVCGPRNENAVIFTFTAVSTDVLGGLQPEVAAMIGVPGRTTFLVSANAQVDTCEGGQTEEHPPP
jgi:hypothetical protein